MKRTISIAPHETNAKRANCLWEGELNSAKERKRVKEYNQKKTRTQHEQKKIAQSTITKQNKHNEKKN